MKRHLSVLLCILLVATVFAGCNDSGQSPAAGSTPADSQSAAPSESAGDAAEAPAGDALQLTYWIITGGRVAHTEYVVEQYEANNNVNIELVINSTDDHKQNLMIAASSNSMPDFWFNWGGSLASFYAENGLTYDLTDYAAANNWTSKYSPVTLDMCTLAGQLCGIPQSTSMFGIIYRKDLFEQAGITAEPTSYAEFEEAMAALKAADITPIAAGGQYGWQVFRLIELLLEKNLGAEKHDQLLAMDTEIWLDEGITKSFEEFKGYVDAGYYPEGFITGDPNNSRNLLYNGFGAMLVDGPSMETNIINDDQDPELYGAFYLPLSDTGSRMTSYVHMDQISVAVSDEKFDTIIDFLDFHYSPEVVTELGAIVQQPLARLDNVIDNNRPITITLNSALETHGGFTITDQGLPQEVINRVFEVQDGVITGQIAPEEVGPQLKEFADMYLANN